MNPPIICFGQQPCGFFPKNFLVAKINTAKNLQKEIGGKIIFFYHDSDADYRETITIMKDGQTGAWSPFKLHTRKQVTKKAFPSLRKAYSGRLERRNFKTAAEVYG